VEGFSVRCGLSNGHVLAVDVLAGRATVLDHSLGPREPELGAAQGGVVEVLDGIERKPPVLLGGLQRARPQHLTKLRGGTIKLRSKLGAEGIALACATLPHPSHEGRVRDAVRRCCLA